ncbi:MAG: amidohydrolase [Alphaproteobacteria bacterium]|nr:amidohydrolase [Alphaproteobacteria bacterium]
MTLETLKRDVCGAIDEMRDELIGVSHAIHAHPELAFEEKFAADLLTRTVEKYDLTVHRGAYGVETAYATEFGHDGSGIMSILSEYDALPGIGHSCGHNIIAAAGLGAALGLSKLGSKLKGRVRYMGTPAEERGSGKEIMAQHGAFEGVDASMMVHPAGFDMVTMPCIALSEVEVIYHGRAAHASAMPFRGLNALDALVTAYQSIAQLRQHIQQTERIHGIIVEGGLAPNIVPERASGRFYIRARDGVELAALKKRVAACFEAGALATGTRLEARWGKCDCLDLKTSWPLADAYEANAKSLGRELLDPSTLPPGLAGSTDMGNVSHRVPSIHPMVQVSPPNVVIHHPDFAAYAKSAKGDQAIIDGAKSMAMTTLDFFSSGELRAQAKAEFAKSKDLSRAAVASAYHKDGFLMAGACGCC